MTEHRTAQMPDDGTWMVLPDLQSINREAARRFVRLANAHSPFFVALAGGNTPRGLYELLARPPYRDQINWSTVHLFWGDERCVPPDHPQSNYRMVEQSLLSHIDIPVQNIHRIKGELDPQQAAATYADRLREILASGQLDLVLLGMGSDGHTASLFPGTLALRERKRTVVSLYVDKLDAWRVTMTLPMLNRARNILFLVSGAAKAPALARIVDGDPLPARRVRPVHSQVTWLVDRAAAQMLA
jgi:6-phosphogluconolactonase